MTVDELRKVLEGVAGYIEVVIIDGGCQGGMTSPRFVGAARSSELGSSIIIDPDGRTAHDAPETVFALSTDAPGTVTP